MVSRNIIIVNQRYCIVYCLVPLTKQMILQWKENEADILKKSKADNGMFFHNHFSYIIFIAYFAT